MSRPWMPLYVADYLADTAHLSTSEHGAYLLLIMHYWTKGKLPENEDLIRRVTRMTSRQWLQSRDVLRSLFGDQWCHKRIDKEIGKALEISKVNSANALRRHSGRITDAERSNTQPQSPIQSKKDSPANAGSKYAFESGIIRLNQKDFDQWKTAYSHLDLAAELLALSQWAESEGKNWFHAVKGALTKRNRTVKAMVAQNATAAPFQWASGIEGVI